MIALCRISSVSRIGEIVEEKLFYDKIALMQQIGLM